MPWKTLHTIHTSPSIMIKTQADSLLRHIALSIPLLAWGLPPSPACAKPGYPEFSWDTVPLYAHVGLGKGLADEEYKFLGEHFQLIAFTGGAMDKEYRSGDSLSFETIAAQGAKRVKSHNPKAKVLFYWAGDFTKAQCKISNAQLPQGTRMEIRLNARKKELVFDTTNKELRDWWTGVAERAVKEYGCDGIFVDGGTCFRPGGRYEKKLGSERNAKLEEAMFQMLREAKERMGRESIILLNPLHGFQGGEKMEDSLGWRYLSVVDGAMIDDFDRAANVMSKRQSPDYIANTIRVMQEASRQGEIIVFKAWPGFTWWSDPELIKKPHAEQYKVAVKNLEFNLAAFLVGAGEYSYFCYTWGWLPEYGSFDWYPEFDKPLGAPKGDAVRDGWTFRREFEHASVFVDIEKRSGKIDWREPK